MAPSRGSFNTADGRFHQVNPPPALSILDNSNNCPPGHQLAIYVHGIRANKNQAIEQIQRVLLSLQKSGYNIPLIGFSWDSDTPFSLDDPILTYNGWNMAKKIANENGPILGKFIIDFKKDCPNDKVRIIAHSLGARVTLSALQWIEDNYINTQGNSSNNGIDNVSKLIASVHFLGAAVNNKQVSTNPSDCISFMPPLPYSGDAIEKDVLHFYNLYNPSDDMLTDITTPNPFCSWWWWYCDDVQIPSIYNSTEYNYALGAYGNKSISGIPPNYREYNVSSQILLDDDSDKINGCDIWVNLKYVLYMSTNYHQCAINKQGDNHMGYMGFRSNSNPQVPVYSSGAIESVVKDWRNGPN